MESYLGKAPCPCGKAHEATIDEILVGSGVLARLPELVRRYNAKKPFLLCDVNAWAAAGERVQGLLQAAGIPSSLFIFPQKALEPDEGAVGGAVMHFDESCDLIIGVGSGVINDLGKILSRISGRRYFIVGTAPSMDGYASANASMSRDGLKVSLDSRSADVIIGDTQILKNAPERMLSAGLGDMLAKYISIAEWRIAHLVTGEYYCQAVAQLVRDALNKCVDNAEGLLRREEAAVGAVFEGLVKSGVAMAYVEVSRPASGVEHYFSHVWDMRGLALGTPVELHGIQCAIGMMMAVRLYAYLKTCIPDAEKARAYVEAFSYPAWQKQLRAFIGAGAETMIAQEAKEQKYSVERHRNRLPKILENWGNILKILEEELPSVETASRLLKVLRISEQPAALGSDREGMCLTFQATKDIRDKYVLSRLAWDLGLMDEMLAELRKYPPLV